MPDKELSWLTARPIAHRGFHDKQAGCPENSLAAFAAAVAANYPIECDLHPAADGTPVVFHDQTLSRMTGQQGSVRDRTANQLREYRLYGTDERIPTLDAMLELVNGRVPLVIELKHVRNRDAGFAAAVVERIRRYGGPAALMSFDATLLSDIRDADPALPRGYIGAGDHRTNLEHLSTITRLNVDFVSYNIDHLPTAGTTFARSVFGLPLICWTVRNPEQHERARLWTDQITFEGFAA